MAIYPDGGPGGGDWILAFVVRGPAGVHPYQVSLMQGDEEYEAQAEFEVEIAQGTNIGYARARLADMPVAGAGYEVRVHTPDGLVWGYQIIPEEEDVFADDEW